MTKQVVILRDKTTWQGTPGWLFVDGNHFCRTLECPWRNNQSQVSCIPTGEYPAYIRHSPHFDRDLYTLKNTSPREWIMIHVGNWAGATDRGYKCDVLGCILLGKEIVKDSNDQMMVTSSSVTVNKFMSTVHNEEFTLQIGGVEGWDQMSRKM